MTGTAQSNIDYQVTTASLDDVFQRLDKARDALGYAVGDGGYEDASLNGLRKDIRDGAKKGAGEANRRRAAQILAWDPQQSGSPFQDAPC